MLPNLTQPIILLGVSICGFSIRHHSATVSAQVQSGTIPAAQRVYVLRGAGPFSQATATATVIRLSSTRFSLSIQAMHLPAPESLRTKFARHAYVAWLVDGTVMHGPMRMAPVGLTFNRQTGAYQGWGTVDMSTVTSVMVSAEPTAKAYMPIMPMTTVLVSVHSYRM